MGSGKSTIARIIHDLYGNEIYSLGFKIHKECELHGTGRREELQQYGQMMRHIFGDNVWCNYLLDRAKNAFEMQRGIVIDDARQLNEYDYFIKLGFLPVAVIADEDIRLNRLKNRVNYEVKKQSEQHETEVQARQNIKRCNIQIVNNINNIDRLTKQVKGKLDKYFI